MWPLALVKVKSTSAFAVLTAKNTTIQYFIQKSSHVVQARYGDVWKAFQFYSRETSLQVSCLFVCFSSRFNGTLTEREAFRNDSSVFLLFLFFFRAIYSQALSRCEGSRKKKREKGQDGSGFTYDAA